MVRAVLFDLDGTLLDTLADLADAVNFALRSLALPERALDEVRMFIGNGAALLIERALPEGQSDLLEPCLRAFKARYQANMEHKTRPYPGILPMLDALREKGIRIGVVSNKPDAAVGPLCETYFPGRIDAALGERADMPKKPAPDGCLAVLRALGVMPEDALYVGDAPTDVKTARNANLRCAGVSWGFRGREELERAGADWVLDDAQALLHTLLGA